MTRTADGASDTQSVGESVKTGWLTARKKASDAGKAGAAARSKATHAAQQKLTERGFAPDQLSEALHEGADLTRKEVGKTTRRTRKKLERKAQQTRKELKKSAKQAKKDAKAQKDALAKPGRKAKKAAIKAAKEAGESKRSGKKDFKASKKAAKSARNEAKALAKSSKKEIIKGEKGKRRKWPWLLGLGAAAGAA